METENDKSGRNNGNPGSNERNKKENIIKILFRQDNPLAAVLLACILMLLIAIFVLLLVKTFKKPDDAQNKKAELQQKITDYANEQKQNDIADMPESVFADSQDIITEKDSDKREDNKPQAAENEEKETAPTSNTIDKSAIIVDVEDENDVSYTKEFILKEMLPYFEANNLEAVWDLAHLKRYVKLSEGLKGSDTYYYQGDVNAEGLPDGKGLAIYENNTYYYGSWSKGMRDGNGRWYRFYINSADKVTKDKRYQAHSYAGDWKNDLPNGNGAEHYDIDISRLEPSERIIQNVVGNFTDGLYDDYMYANTVNYVGLIEEWYGTAEKGVFKSWEDISSLGEYFAWQNRDDNKLYIKIDKKDNKNQGMREMIDFNTKK